jgi:Tol biopolymer transport system component
MSHSEDKPARACGAPDGGAAAEFSALWQQGRPPDLSTFLARAGSLSPEQLMDVLYVDQQQRWLRGERPPAEAYLQIFRSFYDEDEYAVDLLYGEYRLRRELGEAPTAGEYTRRFPDLAGQLRLQVGMHEALYPPAPAADTIRPGGSAEAPPPAAAGSPLSDSSSVPGYRLEQVLGQGGMGVVYRAHDEWLKRAVALKMLHAAGAAEEADRARFRAEAEAAARLQHPHIVQVHETGEHGGRPFLVMELVEGESLAQRLSGAPLPVRPAAELVEALARAAHYAHTRGVVHRDIKPANVLLQADGTPKLGDFGLARRVDADAALTPTGLALGTPGYMAPEQARGSRGVGPAADVYALGAVLYECLTGRPPFQGATAYETVLQVLQDDPVPPRRLRPAVSRDLDTICLKCLEKNPARRYATAEDLSLDLRRFLEGRPVAARPVGLLGRAARWAARRPAAACLVALALVAVLALAGRGVWLERQRTVQRDRAREAIAAVLSEAETLRQEGRWAEGLGVLVRVEGRLEDADSDDLRGRLDQEKAALRALEEDSHAEPRRAREALDLAAEAAKRGLVPPLATIDHRNVAYDLSPDGEQVVFSAADGDLYLLHAPTARVSRLTDTPDEESTPAFSPDGKAVVYAAGPAGGTAAAKSVYVRSLEGGPRRRLTDAPGVSDRSPAYSPDGSRIVFARAHRRRPHGMGGWTWDQWDVCTMRADGTGLQRVTRECYRLVRSPHFSPDGRGVLYSADVVREDLSSTAASYEVDPAAGTPPTPLFGEPPPDKSGTWADEPAPAPDGRRVVVVSDRAELYHYDLLVLSRDGTGPRPLGVTAVNKYNQHPVVAPDGKMVWFLADTGKSPNGTPLYALWQVDMAGGRPRKVADSDLFTDPLGWKPKP